MRKFLTLIIASTLLASTPLMAAEAQASLDELQALGFTSEEINNIDEVTVDDFASTDGDMDTQQRWRRRYCPRGYYLRAYRVRIGGVVIVRYRCVRYYYRDWDMKLPSTQQPNTEQTIQ